MKKIALKSNDFLNQTINFFRLKEEESIICIGCSAKFNELCNNLFVCRFLYDCIIKGIKYHQGNLTMNKEKIAKKISNLEISDILLNFEYLIENKDLIIILAYDFFINWLNDMILEILKNNQEKLRATKNIKYQGHELIDRLNQPELILDDIIKVYLYGKKQEENIRTKPEFWVNLLNRTLEINLTESELGFWESFHIRRNAYSHMAVREKWEKIKTEIKSIELIIWLFGLLLLSYNIDDRLCSKYKLEKQEIKFDFSRKYIYDLEKISIDK